MERLDNVLKSMTLEFFGSGKHKISPSAHLSAANSLFLDVRSKEEHETIAFSLVHHMPVLHIPISEIPERLAEIPQDKTVGIFCSSGVRSTMVYFYLRGLGYENVRIIEGGYAELAGEFKPGKLLKHMSKNNA
ncbi:MAG: rhodanese-like domain-containing protein [Candidatus Cloacimonetes bacterium]|nr:rhodanese-like domain-containing protein [Candidatus Cloacimonadota bacterium]